MYKIPVSIIVENHTNMQLYRINMAREYRVWIMCFRVCYRIASEFAAMHPDVMADAVFLAACTKAVM